MKILAVFAVAAGLVVGALPQTSAPSFAEDAPSAEALLAAQELAALTAGVMVKQGGAPLVDQVWPSVEAALRLKNPTIDAATLAQLRQEFVDLQAKTIVEAASESAPVYTRYFTTEEIRYLIAFYRTPLGAKTLAVMPRVSMEILQTMAPKLRAVSLTVNQRFSAILQQHGYKP